MRIHALFLCSLLGVASWAQDGPSDSAVPTTMTLSLKEAQLKALSTNRTALVSSLEIEKARRKVKETVAIGLPQIAAEASFQHFLDIPTQVLPDFISPTVYNVLINENLLPEGSGGDPSFIPAQFGSEYTMSAGATLNQQIFNGSYLVGLKAAKSFVQMSQLEKEQSDVEIRESVADAYHTVLLAQENAEVLLESITTLEGMLSDITAMYEEGFVEEQDKEQMQLTLNTLVSQQRNADRQIALTKELLNFQIGSPLETELFLTDDISTLIDDPTIEPLLLSENLDLSTHPQMQVIDQGIILQNLRIREQKSRYLPSLNGFLSYQQQAQRNAFNFLENDQEWYPSTVWGVNLALPIFSSGMKANQVKQLEIDLKEYELQKEMSEDGLSLAASQAKSNYLFALDTYEMEQENIALAERIRDKTRIKYEEGISTSFELNESEQQYLDAQGRRIRASLDLLNALTEFKKAYNLL